MFLIVFFQMLALAGVILFGYYIGRKSLLDSHTMGQLSKVINLAFSPMLAISSALSASKDTDRRTWFLVFAVAFCMFLLFILLSYPLAPFFDRRDGQKQMYQMMMIFSNLGFMGIPVVSGVYGAEYAVYVLAFMMCYNLFFYSFGLTLMSGGFNARNLKGMINPGTISVVIAMVIFIGRIEPPVFLTQSIGYIGGLASPLAMLSVGITLAASDLRTIFTNKKIYLFTLMRMVVIPLLAIPLLKLLPLDPILIGVCLIEIAMPIGNLCLTIGMEKGLDCSNCSAGIIMTTLTSVITLPLIVMLL